MITHGTAHFALSEFKHPEIVQPRALDLLEEIRVEYAEPMIITDDGRVGAGDSLHYKGQAFDVRTRGLTRLQMWNLVRAAMVVAERLTGTDRGVEIEIVWSGPQQHVHFGFYLDGSTNRLDGKDVDG